jgi:hypothetical protein
MKGMKCCARFPRWRTTSFPTRSRNHCFRLGNVEILSSDFGLTSVAQPEFLSTLRIGHLTLEQLYEVLEDATKRRQEPLKNQGATKPRVVLPERFTYFDCTDYTDE